MSISERIELIIKELHFGNKRAFSRTAGISTSVTENIVGKRQGNPSFDVLERIALSHPTVNKEWLLTGEGEMLKQAEHLQNQKTNNSYITSEGGQQQYGHNDVAKPYLDFTENSLIVSNGFTLAIENNNNRNIPIPFIGDYDFSLRAYGDSMVNEENAHKSIRHGDIVACKLWNESYIRWGEVYAMITAAGCTIRKIQLSDKEGYIKCVPLNKKGGYHAYEILQSEVLDCAIVVGVASFSVW